MNQNSAVPALPDDTSAALQETDSHADACGGTETANALHRNNGYDFYVVGIGASAGGLDALERFFHHAPPDSGMVYVVIQHLSPDFKSLMSELLARHTSMTIFRVEEPTPVEPNCVYLIPPRKNMVIENGVLLLIEQDKHDLPNLPIDIFFHSLAHDAGSQAIAIVLSGTGSDGSRGIRAVSEAGGLVLVQDVESAAFDGMPRAAQATGLANIVTSPEKMPQRLLSYVGNAGRLPPDQEGGEAVFSEENEMSLLFALLRKKFQVDFALYKPNTILRRIGRRMQLTGSNNIENYIQQLRDDSDEVDALYRDLLVEVTQFFRNPEAFDSLVSSGVIERLIEEATPDDPVRVWVPGCATGEEAYSLGILFQEAMRRLDRYVEVRIFATDVHQQSLRLAGGGLYDEEALCDLPAEYVDRYFEREKGNFVVSKALRKMVIFAIHNLTQDPPFTKLDFISCRNVLIYLKQIAQHQVITRFHFALKKGGVLLLGPSEFIGELGDEFDTIDRRWRIYVKRRDVRLPALTSNGHLQQPGFSLAEIQVGRSGRSRPSEEWIEHLFAAYMPSGFLINADFEILYIFGDATRYVGIQGGRGSLNLLKMLPHDLNTAVRSALHRVQTDDQVVTYTGIRSMVDNVEETLRLTVRPIKDDRRQQSWAMIELIPMPLHRQQEEEAPLLTPFDIGEESQERMELLERELEYTKEHLQTTIEELETTNEELQSTNEELVASNEELQSTNEELQSVNEELYTVNAEYQHKIEELMQLTADMENLQASTQIGVIFLDPELRIREFSSTAAARFNLLGQDVGRPVEHLLYSISLTSDELKEYATQVLEGGDSVERELVTPNKQNLLLRVLPYKTANDEIDGVVLTVLDISKLKEAEAERDKLTEELHSANRALRLERDLIRNSLSASEARFQKFIDNAGDSIIVTELDGTIFEVNQTACQMLAMDKEQLLGRSFAEVDVGLDDHMITTIQALLEKGKPVTDDSIQRRGDGSTFPVEMRSVKLEIDGRDVILVVSRDITERKEREAKFRQMNDDLALANQQLAKSNEELDRFVYIAAHDLKEPLRGMTQYAQMIKHVGSEALPENLLQYTDSLVRMANRMKSLIDELRAYARLTRSESGAEQINLKELIEQITSDLGRLIREQKIRLKIAHELPTISYVHPHARAVFQNLISNAAKYNDREEKIIEIGTIEWEQAENELNQPDVREISCSNLADLENEFLFYVKDNGIGIPSKHYDRVFDMFRRLHVDEAYGGGTGAGLALVKRIIEIHGGGLWLQSTEGAGSTFYFTL